MLKTLALLISSPHVWAGAALIALFWVATQFVDYPTMRTIMRTMATGFAVAVVIAFMRGALLAVRQPFMRPQSRFTLGYFVVFAGILIGNAFIISWRVHNPHAPIDSQILNFGSYLIILGAMLGLTTPGMFGKRVPSLRWIVLGSVIGLSSAVAWLLLNLNLEG